MRTQTLRQTQKARVINLLATGRRMSKLDLMKAGCGTKPDTRISELRAERHRIKDEWVTRQGSRYKRYYLERKH